MGSDLPGEAQAEPGRLRDGAVNPVPVNPDNAPARGRPGRSKGSLFPAAPLPEVSVVVCWRHHVCPLQPPAPARSSGGARGATAGSGRDAGMAAALVSKAMTPFKLQAGPWSLVCRLGGSNATLATLSSLSWCFLWLRPRPVAVSLCCGASQDRRLHKMFEFPPGRPPHIQGCPCLPCQADELPGSRTPFWGRFGCRIPSPCLGEDSAAQTCPSTARSRGRQRPIEPRQHPGSRGQGSHWERSLLGLSQAGRPHNPGSQPRAGAGWQEGEEDSGQGGGGRLPSAWASRDP